MIKLRTLFTPQVQRPWSATYELRLGRHRFIAQVVDGQLVQVRRGEPDGSSDTVIDTDPDTLSAVLAEDRALARALGDGKLTIKGDDEAAHRLFEASRA